MAIVWIGCFAGYLQRPFWEVNHFPFPIFGGMRRTKYQRIRGDLFVDRHLLRGIWNEYNFTYHPISIRSIPLGWSWMEKNRLYMYQFSPSNNLIWKLYFWNRSPLVQAFRSTLVYVSLPLTWQSFQGLQEYPSWMEERQGLYETKIYIITPTKLWGKPHLILLYTNISFLLL